MTEYWFARRFPLGSGRGGVAPVHWKGHAVMALYVVTLVLGGVAFAWFGAHDNLPEGIAIFALAAFLGTMLYLSVTRHKGDPIRTAAEYKKDRAGV